MFIVIKITLFIKQILALSGKGESIKKNGYCAFFGIGIILFDTITEIQLYIRYRCCEKQLKEGQYVHTSSLIAILNRSILSVGRQIYCIPYSKH